MTGESDCDLWVIGSGGHAKVVVSTAFAAGIKVAGLLDDGPGRVGQSVFGVRVISRVDSLREPASAIIAIGMNKVRERIAAEHPSIRWCSVIHPTASVAKEVGLGKGTIIVTNAVIQPGAVVGDHVIVNTSAIIEHDCTVGDLVHVASGVVLGGGVTIGRGTLVGSGATILQGIKVGHWCTIGAGAVVTRDVRDGATVVGIPAREV